MDKNKLRSLLNEGKTQNALDNLLEELETKATKKANPELSNPELKNSDVYTKDSHSAVEEVKEVIVESKDLSAKEKMNLLLEKYGVSSMRELAVEERTRFLKELNDPNTKFVKADVLLEADTPQETNAKARETNATAEMMKQKRLAMQNNGPKSARVSGQKVNAEVESPEDDEIDAEETELEPEVQANDKDVNDTKDKEGDDTIKQDKKALTKDENIDSVNESLESIFDILRDIKPLREEEVTDKGDAAAEPVATDDADAETEEPDTDNEDVYSKEEHNEDEEVEEVVVESEDKLDVSDPVKQQYEVEKEIAPSDAPEPEVTTSVKGGEVKVDAHDHADEEGKKVRAEVIEEEVTSKGEVAHSDNEATDEEKPESEEPNDDNEDVFPADEHKEVEEVEEVVVEDAIQVSENAVFITLPIRENEKFAKELSDKEQEIVTEALKEVYGVFTGKKLNEDFEVPADSEAGLKVYKEKIEIELPVSNPSEQITESDAARLQEALEVLDAVLKEMSTAGIAAPDMVNNPTKDAVKGKDDPENADQVDNEDLYADEHKQEDDVEEVLVEEVISELFDGIRRRLADGKLYRGEVKKAKLKTELKIQKDREQLSNQKRENLYNSAAKKPIIKAAKIEGQTERGVNKQNTKTQFASKRNETKVEKANTYLAKQVNKTDKQTLGTEKVRAKINRINNSSKGSKVNSNKINRINNSSKGSKVNSNVNAGMEYANNDFILFNLSESDLDMLFENVTEYELSIIEEFVDLYEEEVTSKGDAAHSDNEATKEDDGSADAPKDDNADVYPKDEHKEAEEVKEVIVEAEEKKELPEELEKNTKDDKDDEDKVPEKLEDDSKDEDHDEESDDDDKEEKESKEEEKEESEDSVVNEEIEKEPKSAEELNDAGSDTINNDGELEDPADEKEDEKAQPEDVTEGYKSIKEAFLLEADYFSKDSKVLLTADEKRSKLENQMSLLIARESQDPLYEELVRTTILAKKLQEQLHDRYSEAAKGKASQLISLKEEMTDKGDVAATPLATDTGKANELTPDYINSDIYPVEDHEEEEEVKEVVIEGVTLTESDIDEIVDGMVFKELKEMHMLLFNEEYKTELNESEESLIESLKDKIKKGAKKAALGAKKAALTVGLVAAGAGTLLGVKGVEDHAAKAAQARDQVTMIQKYGQNNKEKQEHYIKKNKEIAKKEETKGKISAAAAIGSMGVGGALASLAAAKKQNKTGAQLADEAIKKIDKEDKKRKENK